jgi:hypothetical protein
LSGPGGAAWGNAPWPNRLEVGNEMGLTEQQVNQLRRGYNLSAKDRGGPSGMSPAERARRQRELQARGFDGFADPAVLARLNLNDNQVRQLNALAQQYNAGLSKIRAAGQTDPAATANQFEALRKQSLDTLNAILVPQQLQAWSELAGRPFDVPPVNGAAPPPGAPMP